jgi:hypothetical protein
MVLSLATAVRVAGIAGIGACGDGSADAPSREIDRAMRHTAAWAYDRALV